MWQKEKMEKLPVLIFAIILIAWLTLNTIATYVVFKTSFIVKERRIYQTIFIWLIPFIGSTLAIYLNRQEYFDLKKKDEIGNHPNISNEEAFNYAIEINQHNQHGDSQD